MANRSGVDFGSSSGRAISGILDGVLQGFLLKKQQKQQDRQFSLQQESQTRLRERDEFEKERVIRGTPPELGGALPEAPTQSGLTQQISGAIDPVVQQSMVDLKKALRGAGVDATPELDGFESDISKIFLRAKATGEQQRENIALRESNRRDRPIPPEAEPTENELQKEVSQRIKGITSANIITGLPSINVDENIFADPRFGPQFLSQAVETAVRLKTTTAEVVQSGFAATWADSVTELGDKTEQSADFADELKSRGITATTVVAEGDSLNARPEIGEGTFDDGPQDLEDIAKKFIQQGKSEEDFREFVFELLVQPNLQEVNRSGELFKAFSPGKAASIGQSIGSKLFGQ